MSGRGARGRPPQQSRLLFVSLGFIIGALISTVIQNISDAHLELYHRAQDELRAATAPPAGAPPPCSLPSRCGRLSYAGEDPITAASARAPAGMVAWHYKDLRVDLRANGSAAAFAVSEPCFAAVQDGAAEATNSLIAGVVPADKQAMKKKCKTIEENVLIIGDTLGRAPANLFDELSTVWYHLWLLKRGACGAARGGRWRVTHLSGILNDMPPRYPQRWAAMATVADRGVAFPAVLGLLGKYVPWEELAEGAEGGCLKFKRAATTPSTWLWLGKPVPAAATPPLQDLVDAILDDLGQGGPRTGRCNFRALYASRAGAAARRVTNEPALLEALAAAMPGFAVEAVDLGDLPFEEQVAKVRAADVFVFPHGGAGPHVLWLPHGAVALELFPYADADPMYRNLAVQTGKAYLSWQAGAFATPFDWKKIGPRRSKDVYHFSNASDFEVDTEKVGGLAAAAAAMVRNTLGTNWFPSGGGGGGGEGGKGKEKGSKGDPVGTRHYSSFLCTMCAEERKGEPACVAEDGADRRR